jgi:uncharacterized protein
MWRGLPDRVFIARGFVPPGEYDLRLPNQLDSNRKLAVDGRYMVVPVRVYRNKTYFGEPVKIGMLPPVMTPAVEEAPAAPAAPAKRPGKSIKPAKPAVTSVGKEKKA